MLLRAPIIRTLAVLMLPAFLVLGGRSINGSSQVSDLAVLGVIPMTLSAQAVAVDSVRNRVFVLQDDSFGRDGFELVILDGTDHSTLGRIRPRGIMSPYGIAVDETARRVYVHNGWGLVVVDADTLERLADIGLPYGGGAVAVDPETNRLFVGVGIQLFVIDGASGGVLDQYFLSALARNVAIDPAHNRVWITHETAGFFSAVDLTAGSVSKVPIVARIVDPTTGNPNASILAMGIDAVLGQAYLAQRTNSGPADLFVYDTASLGLLGAIPIEARTEGLAVDPSSHLVYAPSGTPRVGVTIVDGTTRTSVARVPVPVQTPRGAAVNPITQRSYYPDALMEPVGGLVVIGFPNAAPTADAGADQLVECGSAGALLDGSASSDPDGDPLSFEWKNAEGSIVGNTGQLAIDLPLGIHTFTLTVTDDDGATSSDTVTVVVQDTTPPVISSAAATPSILWPPDGRMLPVAVNAAAADACDATASCRIVRVRSSEPATGRGSGRRTPDMEITGATSALLRAERSGAGAGRTYTIEIECGDGSGNVVPRAVEVLVPHDRRR